MNQPYFLSRSLADFSPLRNMKKTRSILELRLELTARCNNDCRHCYICLPDDDMAAFDKEPTFPEIEAVADQAIKKGALWCTITGGEPLLRDDFKDIYLNLKRKGFLVSVFTNATRINQEHIELFRRYPPAVIDVTVYGITRKTYETVTRQPGSYKAFMHGLNLLLDNGFRVRLKAIAIRSNYQELPQIAKFCQERTKDYYRFDPMLHLRLDHNAVRNEEIKSERLTPQEIVTLEMTDTERFNALKKNCAKLIDLGSRKPKIDCLFSCNVGINSIVLGYDGNLRPCLLLCKPNCIYDLRRGSLDDAWQNFVPKVRNMSSNRKEFLDTCQVCSLKYLCKCCPAHAYLETGELDAWVEYYCQVAHAKAEMLGVDMKRHSLTTNKYKC